MCGITGFWEVPQSVANEKQQTIINKMTEQLYRRGPDAAGIWTDFTSGIAIGHRRLSIIDLSTTGHQPMVSASGQTVIAYNGEIYNYRELKIELENMGITFRGNSDSEVLLEACEIWGVKKTVEKLIGMFAFAVWDRSKKMFYLVRDRLGIKPLYWGQFGNLFLFGSELKALRAHPGWQVEIDRDSIAAYMRHNYIPTPNSIYKNIFKLPAGCILTKKIDQEVQISEYWSLSSIVQTNQEDIFNFSEQENINTLNELLGDAVSRRMLSDVPFGAFLSGGVDSSIVVALMQANNMRPVKTFSIGFNETGFDEAGYAKSIATYLGTDHTELYVSPEEAQAVIPQLPDIYDEPFADSSQIPTYLVSKLAQRSVKVALSGDGGDEVFAGYNRYFHGKRLIKGANYCPNTMKKVIEKIIYLLPPDKWSSIANIFPEKYSIPQFGDKIYKIAGLLSHKPEHIYQYLISHWQDPNSLVINGKERNGIISDSSFSKNGMDTIEYMQLLDTLTYLPDDILTKVDRASMATSLEARVPLLDHRVIEFSWKLPMNIKVRNGQGKWILRQLLYKYVPEKLIDRPKMGFGIPIGKWLRGPLKDWSESLLDENRIREQGYLNAEPIKVKWKQHLSGERNWQYSLWNILMFQAWYEYWIKN